MSQPTRDLVVGWEQQVEHISLTKVLEWTWHALASVGTQEIQIVVPRYFWVDTDENQMECKEV